MLSTLILDLITLCAEHSPVLDSCTMLPNHIFIVCVPEDTFHRGLAHYGMSVVRDYLSVQGEYGVFLVSECRGA